MSFFTRRLLHSTPIRLALGTSLIGTGIFTYDYNTEAQVLTRNVRTFYNGIALAIDYKVNFQPGHTKEEAMKIEQIHERTANRVFDVFERNAGLYIKVGQVIGTQAAVLPSAYQRRAVQLFDSAPAVPFESVERVFMEDFNGLHPNEVFAEFDTIPVASASIAQVHKAKLKNGDLVAVKIQKPAIRKQMDWDLAAFRLLLKLYEHIFDLPLSWSSDYIEEHMRMEANFKIEANNAKKAWKHLQEEKALKDRVYVPKVYDEYSSERVLVCEWIDGIQLTDIKVLKENGIDYTTAMKTAIEVFASQIFRSGFVHGDPHPGNVLVRKNPNNKNQIQVVLIDHGLYIQEAEKFRLEYCQLWEALFMLDIPRMSEICKEWGIHDATMFATITLQRPFSGKKAVHIDQKVDLNEMYELQTHMKERIKNFLYDQALFPRELIFISRNMNIVRANNKAVGSPINRINIMARWAVLGLSKKKGSWLSWRSVVFECTLFLMSVGFWLVRLKNAANKLLFDKKSRGLEDILDERMRDEMFRQFGVKVDPAVFDG
ncbi:ABC1 family-domain-containing protein [Cokeromyces recurvatus]|uniref:ABC1 family-domain-containing protein n=1 Tax=Cokeromyces recurvatus TaxID=90255 RepID=UPI00221FF4EA|nr:ABC1 family-domain-containing protein [Cokeromyces recurvatus]KAI7900502.1 ABC1 family-domain-containing protein [Cokeromyces recurvatus]